MPRFYFHVHDGENYPDLQGTELVDSTAARREAVLFAGALLADRAETFWEANKWTLRVADDEDLTLFTLDFVTTSMAAVQGR